MLFLPAISAQTVIDYEVEPEEPTPLSDVTVTATIEDDAITALYVTMQECTTAGVCYGWDTNVSMTSVADNQYEGDFTLQHDDAGYFSLVFVINRDGEWEETTDYKIDLDLSGTSNGSDNGDGSSTPGFEILLVLIASIIVLFSVKRKRY